MTKQLLNPEPNDVVNSIVKAPETLDIPDFLYALQSHLSCPNRADQPTWQLQHHLHLRQHCLP